MPKKINEIGNKYGKLTVIEEAPKTEKQNEINWICLCECGNIISVRGTSLRQGKTKTCGKCHQANFIDETGNRYGKLIVLKEANKKPNRSNIYWVCQCDCGEIIEVSGSDLRKENGTRSCKRCSQKINRIGEHFGLLTVIEELPQSKYKCQCQCGNTIIMTNKEISRQHRLSCGCLKSIGEAKILHILQENNVLFEEQKYFKDCIYPKTNYHLYFDFYLPKYNVLIEYDGEYHFKEWKIKNRNLLSETQERDKFKNQWCKENNIPLIRIPYTHLKDLCIEDLLLETTTFLVRE